MASPDPSDLTPESASPTDIAPLGQSAQKPAHERTAAEEMDNANWDAIAADADYKKLLVNKARLIVPATIFFVIYYFTLPILVGWFPEMMSQRAIGPMNWAYLFALSQFFMAWVLAFIYVAAAAGWDKQTALILAKFNK